MLEVAASLNDRLGKLEDAAAELVYRAAIMDLVLSEARRQTVTFATLPKDRGYVDLRLTLLIDAALSCAANDLESAASGMQRALHNSAA